MPMSPKDVFKDYLQGARDALVWKLDGLNEHQIRRPLTPTGTNLLGLVNHATHTEALYFGPVFGRPSPLPHVPDAAPLSDFYATADESRDDVIDRYRRVQTATDQTITELPLDAVGHVPHWDNAEVSLLEVLVHVTSDLQRHAGHADILQENLDGATGLLPSQSNQPAERCRLGRSRRQPQPDRGRLQLELACSITCRGSSF